MFQQLCITLNITNKKDTKINFQTLVSQNTVFALKPFLFAATQLQSNLANSKLRDAA